MAFKKNCWEAKACGRQAGGAHTSDLGICPAAVDTSVDGLHDGKNGGRICWVVAETHCGGKVQGSYDKNNETCTVSYIFIKINTEQ